MREIKRNQIKAWPLFWFYWLESIDTILGIMKCSTKDTSLPLACLTHQERMRII